MNAKLTKIKALLHYVPLFDLHVQITGDLPANLKKHTKLRVFYNLKMRIVSNSLPLSMFELIY